MLAYIKKHYLSILIVVLLIISINGMIRYKLLAETTSTLATFHTYDRYFKFYRGVLVIGLFTATLALSFRFWKQRKQPIEKKKNTKGFLLKYLSTVLIIIVSIISINGITSLKLLGERTVTEETLEQYDFFFKSSQAVLITIFISILLVYLFNLWRQYRLQKNTKVKAKSIPSKYYKILLIIILVIIAINGMIYFKLLGERSTTITSLRLYDAYFAFFQILLITIFTGTTFSWLFNLWKQYKELKNKKTEAELALLKSKMDPHFFFNTLNNLYGLAIEKADETPEVILKLSEVMRYTIYKGENETVSIKDEISYLEKYIEIHKIRYKKKVDIQFEKDIDQPERKVPPLLFIMLLENAFKHGVETLKDDAYIHLKLFANKELIIFTIENNFRKIIKHKQGVGLENLKRRLTLLFPKKHSLEITTKPSVFNVQLHIKLS